VEGEGKGRRGEGKQKEEGGREGNESRREGEKKENESRKERKEGGKGEIDSTFACHLGRVRAHGYQTTCIQPSMYQPALVLCNCTLGFRR